MPFAEFDRARVKMLSLSERENRTNIETTAITPESPVPEMTDSGLRIIQELVQRIHSARAAERPVMLAFGAHAIKNGLGPVFRFLMENNWVTHLATNGAGIIHDWEFAFQGLSSEHVGVNVDRGRFGNWNETGYYINLAINVGAFEGRGYGESVGAFIHNDCLSIPSEAELLEHIGRAAVDPLQAAAAADLLQIIRTFELDPGTLPLMHHWKQFSAQAGAFANTVPLTGHPMIGHDIIYNHPMNHCAALGRAAQRDFLIYANNVSQLEGGVYMSIGSAVMSPMIFEKSLSMAQNVAIQDARHLDNHFILVNDLAESTWDWSKGEPPENDPSYYLRYNKSFSRMGGQMRYLQADNRSFLLNLLQQLK